MVIFVDSNIPMYAAGQASAQKEACLRYLTTIVQGRVDAASSAEVLQEILHRYRAIGRLTEGLIVYHSFRELPIIWFDVAPDDVDNAASLLEQLSGLSSRDALHLAVMQRHKIKKILTYDKGFLGISGVTVELP